ncbi:LON peptidase substrate-binding domain-containing protein, partial [uncultured Microbacterium sp.]
MDAAAMFPLGTVLFPHTPLLLRIFEPRYLTMLGRLLDDEEPQFGVVLIARGREAGGGEEREGIATMARIVKVDPSGTDALHVIAVGGE